jgi:hypothetical protein
MSAPLYVNGAFGDAAALAVAFVIGIGFGFFLERAGFGSARKLVSQFYLDDLAVFKVMFTAIVTALVGASLLAGLGVLDLDLIDLTPTFWWPQVVGGLLLGFGFVIGGYCPGTSVAACATGRADALLYGLGILGGSWAFSEAYPLFSGFFLSGERGALTLPETFGLPRGVVVLAVVLMALAGFWAAGKIEARFRATR